MNEQQPSGDTPRPPGRGRPKGREAEAHAKILDTVYEMLQRQSLRDLTMEGIAREAGVGKPTLYKWWPSKSMLAMAMFRERLVIARPEPKPGETAEEAIRKVVCSLVQAFSGPLGRIMIQLIAEAQSEPEVLQSFFDEHIRGRRTANAANIDQGVEKGELLPGTDAQLLIDSIFGAIYYRLLFRNGPLDKAFGEELVAQAFHGVKVRAAGALT